MPDWAIVLIAAFGGGLAGSVLQPVISHVLDAVRREEVIRRGREKSLRRMLTAAFDHGRRVAAWGDSYFSRQKAGVPMTQLELAEKLHLPEDYPSWQPERIADQQLREVAERYGVELTRLKPLLMSPELPEDEIIQLGRSLRSLEKQAICRMDELNWPEVDE